MGSKSSRLIVVDDREESRVPFLRGILTRSLQEAGMPFDDAYELASQVRDAVSKEDEVRLDQLRAVVAKQLVDSGWSEVHARYTKPKEERVLVEVRGRSGHVAPFSKGLLGQSMEICALPRDEAYAVAAEVEFRMVRDEIRHTSSADLGRLTARVLRRRVGEDAARRYLRWVHFTHSGVPLILLIGGTTGCGKSTVSATLANRLGIVRTQSTDMLREVMRLLVPAKLLPALHQSSFGAYRSLPRWRMEDNATVEPHMLDGYLMQSDEVAIAVEGVFKRAVSEQVSLIAEGVHINPALQRRLMRSRGAVVVPFVLAALKRKKLRGQLVGRGQQITARRAERYLDYFDEIWQLQTFLLSEADRHRIPIIQNGTLEDSLRQAMLTVSDALKDRFSADPDVVFEVRPTQP